MIVKPGPSDDIVAPAPTRHRDKYCRELSPFKHGVIHYRESHHGEKYINTSYFYFTIEFYRPRWIIPYTVINYCTL